MSRIRDFRFIRRLMTIQAQNKPKIHKFPLLIMKECRSFAVVE
ncbi:hypothetical protein [Gluconobacter albidus]|nr:hypothetical protein [Gluconobacter albidus]